MKIIHLSDLHIGKRVNGYSMLEDQEYILNQILNIIDGEKPQAVVIAGDVYDKTVPSAEAVQFFDDFITSLARRRVKTFIVSGNHDSPERIAFGSRIFSEAGIHLSPVFDGNTDKITLSDQFGSFNFYILPFIKPANVKKIFQDEEINTYDDALKSVVEKMKVNTKERNILVAHQFVTGAKTCESEEFSVGALDNVDVSIFDDFDYVALGHIHGPQKIGRETVRYCGTPLKYSFSEVNHKKSVTIAEFLEKDNINISTVPLIPKRDMIEIKGNYSELVSLDFYRNINREDYVHVTLTDEDDVPEAFGKLQSVYKNLMKLDYDNKRTRNFNQISATEENDKKSPHELFSELYRLQNNNEMTEEQNGFVSNIIEKIWGEVR